MKEESKDQGIKKSKEKLIIIILSATIVILFLISGYYIYKDMSATPDSNGNDNSQTEGVSATPDSNGNDNSQIEGVSSTSNSNENISSQTNQVENDIEFKEENDGLSIYNKDNQSLIRKIKHANAFKEIKLNENTFYNIECSPSIGGHIAIDMEVLDENGKVIIDKNSFPIEYDDSYKTIYSKRCSPDIIVFDALYDTNNNLIAVNFLHSEKEKNKIYIFDLKGNLVNTITRENIIAVFDDYFITQENKNIKIIDYNNIVIKEINLRDDEEIGDDSHARWIYWSKENGYFEIGVTNPSPDYDYLYRYYPKTNELKKLKITTLSPKGYEVIE